MVDSYFWRDRSVFVTGHTGFKGAWLTMLLKHLGAQVTGFSLAPEPGPNLFSLANVDKLCVSLTGDIRDEHGVREAIHETKPDIVLHLAAQGLVRRSYRNPVETYATNVMGTVHVLDAVRATPSVKAAVMVTSDKCYENMNWVWGYRENEAMGGHDPYSSSKGCSELVTAAYRSSFFGKNGSADALTCRVGSGRAGNVIGGGDWAEDRLIPDIIKAFAEGRAVEIRSPRATRPWQHVLEPLHGYLRLAEVLAQADGEAYAEGWNFGPADDDCKPVSYIVERLSGAWGQNATWYLSQDVHVHEAHLLKVDAAKARTRLGWAPRLNLDQALTWTVDWYRAVAADRSRASALCNGQIERFLAMGPRP